MVGSGDGAGQLSVPGRPTTLAYGRAGACCACSRCGIMWAKLFIFFISSILASFSNASSVGRQLDILKYCGLSHYNPVVIVSYYQRRAHLVLVNRLLGLSLPRNSVSGELTGLT